MQLFFAWRLTFNTVPKYDGLITITFTHGQGWWLHRIRGRALFEGAMDSWVASQSFSIAVLQNLDPGMELSDVSGLLSNLRVFILAEIEDISPPYSSSPSGLSE